MTINFDLFQAGYCTNQANIVLKDEKKKKMKLPAVFACIEHPLHGYILFDTGYAERFFEETNSLPYSIYAKITPVYLAAGESAVDQLETVGIKSEDISYVFISHFHADHIAGLKDFPHSQFICSKVGYDLIKNKTGISALKSGFIPNLMPSDFESRAVFIEDCMLYEPMSDDMDKEKSEFIHTYANIYDVFGDRTLLSVDLSGHAAGQFGLFFKTDHHYVFLVADTVWRSRSYREQIYPKSIAKLIMSDPRQYKRNLDTLYEFHKNAPNVFIVPSHCEDVIKGAYKA